MRNFTMAAGLIIAIGVYWSVMPSSLETEPELDSHQLVASFSRAKCETVEDVEHVVAHAVATPRAVMFINLDWAIMEPQRTHFAEFVIEWERLHPDQVVWFHYVDATPVTHKRYKPLRDIPGWQQLEAARGVGSLIHGWGEVVWIEEGTAVRVERILDHSVSDLVKQTESLFTTD